MATNDVQRINELLPINRNVLATVFTSPTGHASLFQTGGEVTPLSSGQYDNEWTEIGYYVTGGAC